MWLNLWLGQQWVGWSFVLGHDFALVMWVAMSFYNQQEEMSHLVAQILGWARPWMAVKTM